MTDFKNIVQEILDDPLFTRLKNVVENIEGWHDHEDVYSHSLATMERARKFVHGDFINNQLAKKRFLSWMNSEIEGFKISEILILTALVHDMGKILSYREDDYEFSMNLVKENGQTNCPGHGYWGAKLVISKVFENMDIPQKIKQYISKIVEQHTVFNEFFFGKDQLKISDLLLYAKAQAEGYYKETMFNAYCDCYTATAFENSKKRIEELFNQESLYIPREYFIAK